MVGAVPPVSRGNATERDRPEARPEHTAGEVLGLRVAELDLWLDARGTGLRLQAPPSYDGFARPASSHELANQGGLVVRVQDAPLPDVSPEQILLCQTKIWQLWQRQDGRYVFARARQRAPRPAPSRHVIVNAEFTDGKVIGDFSSIDTKSLYPLQSLDIRLYANWLANYGEVILHSAGVAVDGQGFCFVGPSGAGKSTLAASLISDPRAVVLGEDQVVLRYLEGRFWVYGTPWHVQPDFCAPLGVPLQTIFVLDRTAPPGVGPCAPSAGVARLMQTAFIPYYRPAAVAAILDRLALLAERVPFYTLSYQLGTDALELIEGA